MADCWYLFVGLIQTKVLSLHFRHVGMDAAFWDLLRCHPRFQYGLRFCVDLAICGRLDGLVQSLFQGVSKGGGRLGIDIAFTRLG